MSGHARRAGKLYFSSFLEVTSYDRGPPSRIFKELGKKKKVMRTNDPCGKWLIREQTLYLTEKDTQVASDQHVKSTWSTTSIIRKMQIKP